MDEDSCRAEEKFGSDPNVEPGLGETGSEQQQKEKNGVARGEIDTSAPFESVKEAVTRFGGIGFWKPHMHKPSDASENGIEDSFDAAKAEEQAMQLENDLIVKERETLEVLKELEATKATVEELKVRLQKEAAEVNAALHNRHSDDQKVDDHHKNGVEEDERNETDEKELASEDQQHLSGVDLMCPSSSPGFILMELKQAKLNLTRTTNDLADIRVTVETFNKKIEKERLSLEKTRQRLSLNSSKISSLEEEISQTQQKLEAAKGSEKKAIESENSVDLSRELHRLTSETEQFKKVGEAAKSEVLRVLNGIEQTKTRIKTAEIRLVAARKLKEAAKASEALARSEIKALSKSQTSSEGGVTLSYAEYSSLTLKAREAEEACKRRMNDAMIHIDEAEVSKAEILKRVEEATEEVKSSKRVLEEALSRVEAANNGKLEVEEALRRWRSEHGQRRKSSVHNSAKFKNSSYPSPHVRSNSRLFDVNGTNFPSSISGPVLRPTMSIGQILSRKLLLTEEYSEKSSIKKKVSLAQMLSKPSNGEKKASAADDAVERRLLAKRKKFGFGRIAFLVSKPSKKKKKHSISSRLSCGAD